ncbi:MAG: hypothetical protein ACE5PT_05150 [Gemmatimonadales bacterium]
MTRYDDAVERLRSAVLSGPGALDRGLREAAYGAEELPGALGHYVAKVRLRAHEVSGEDIDAVRADRRSDDEIFEATVCAALGAGLTRLERGMSALEASRGS